MLLIMPCLSLLVFIIHGSEWQAIESHAESTCTHPRLSDKLANPKYLLLQGVAFFHDMSCFFFFIIWVMSFFLGFIYNLFLPNFFLFNLFLICSTYSSVLPKVYIFNYHPCLQLFRLDKLVYICLSIRTPCGCKTAGMHKNSWEYWKIL